jgi:phage tail sheath protein FI
MPEYSVPDGYVEESSFRMKSIEGVSTNITGFIGPARQGPIGLQPDLLTGLADFERLYGGPQSIHFAAEGEMDHYLWHGARAFFEEGGKRLYISRIFKPIKGTYPPSKFKSAGEAPQTEGRYNDGHARAAVPSEGGKSAIQIRGRFPGAAGNRAVRLTLALGENRLGGTPAAPSVARLLDYDLVWIKQITTEAGGPPRGGRLYLAKSYYDMSVKKRRWRFTDTTLTPPVILDLSNLTPGPDEPLSDRVCPVTLSVSLSPAEEVDVTQRWDLLALDPKHRRAGLPDSFSKCFGPKPPALSQAPPIIVELGRNIKDGLGVAQVLFNAKKRLMAALDDPRSSDTDRSIDLDLSGGNDGERPTAAEYEGKVDKKGTLRTGLKLFEAVAEISIVAAPGATYRNKKGDRDESVAISRLLISHAERMRHCFALVDSGDGQTISEVRAMRALFDSKSASLYYPWITILDPATGRKEQMPPSGFVAGLYVRNDLDRGVSKAPANEVVHLAVGLETMLTKGDQEILNPEGINCFRFFPGRGHLLWGARTLSSDPEWKYVNLRRYAAYLERSIDQGTQWVVFEPNGERLWADVRQTVEDFLLNEWRLGALLGDKPEKAYFVRCDRTTMTQDDLDNGRLNVVIGIAPLKPAEFVIFRIGQWTADRKP